MLRFFCLLLLLSLDVSAQKPIEDFFLFENGDPAKVYAVFQDKSGYMWMGTSNGLYRFNGQYDLTNISSVIHQPVTAIAELGNNVYVGYSNGAIGRITADSVTLLNIRNSKPHHAINDLLVSSFAIWAATDEGLYAIVSGDGSLLAKRNGLPGDAICSVIPSTDGGLVLGTAGGLCKLNIRGGRLAIKLYGAGNGLPGNSVSVIKQVPNTNYAWLGTDNGIVRVAFNGSSITAVPYKQNWKWGAVKDILVLSETHIWVGTDGYLLDVHVRDFIAVNPHHYPNKSFNKLVYTKAGVIWAGTDVGMSVLSAEIAAELEVPPPYNMNALTATACDKHNNLWLAELNKLYKMPLGTKAQPENVCSLPGVVSCLYSESEDGLWIGTDGKGLWRLQDKHLAPAFYSEAMNLDSIVSISRRGENLWVSSNHGIDEFFAEQNRLRLVKHHQAADIGSDRATYLYNDSRNRMWLATDGAGVCMYDNRYHRFDSGADIGSRTISTITEDAYGDIWVGALNRSGISRFDGRSWRKFTLKNGLQNMSISTLSANGTGQVVIMNDLGVDEWFPASNQFRRYNVTTNPSIDSTSYIPNIAVKDTAGNVYIPGVKGMLMFKNVVEPVELKPQVAIKKVSVFLKPVPFGKHEFAYRENTISFTVDAINFSNYERLHIRYMLQGYNTEWINLSDKTITFPQLNPGSYTFRVQASLTKNFDVSAEESYAFTVFAPLWMQPWFIALSLVGIGALLFIYIRQRERKVKNIAQLKQERTQFEYELFKSQVNPHFLFNSLNILIDLIDENQVRAVDYTVQLSALYRNILTYQNKETFLLAEECRLLSAYMHIQKNRFGKALQLDVDIAQSVLDTRKVVPLALQLLVENAIKHNMVSLASPLTVRIYISKDAEIVVQNRIQPKISREAGAGIGLQNIAKRYSLLTKKAVQYGVVDTDYIVKLPLL